MNKKTTGIIRRIDELGRIVVPKEIRRTIGLKEGDFVEISLSNGIVSLQKPEFSCPLCNKTLTEEENKYILSIEKVERSYKYNLNRLENILRVKTDWNYFSDEEKLITENTILLVGLLYNMCKVELVLKSNSEDELNRINKVKVDETIQGASDFLRERSLLIY